jgi:hypothetical protein
MLIAPPPPPVPIVTVDRPTQVSAYGSGVLFSKRDPSTGRFKLWYTETGRPPAPLDVRDRAVPFDADLGPGANGHFVAVYSRCKREPRWDPLDEDAPPNYSLGRGCDLFELDLTTGVERRLPASSKTADETLPAVWKDGLAFARRYSSGKTVLYSRRASAASRRMPGGPAGGRPNGIDLYGRRLAFGWEYPGRYDGPASDLRLVDVVRRQTRLIDRFTGGGLTTISLTAPAFEAGKLYYARLCQGDEAGCPHRAGLIRVRYSTGERTRADIFRYDLWQARGAGVTYVLHDDEGWRSCFNTATGGSPETCTIRATTPSYVEVSRATTE